MGVVEWVVGAAVEWVVAGVAAEAGAGASAVGWRRGPVVNASAPNADIASPISWEPRAMIESARNAAKR